MAGAARRDDVVLHGLSAGPGPSGASQGALAGLVLAAAPGAAAGLASAIQAGAPPETALADAVTPLLPGVPSGVVATGSPSVFVNGKAAVRAGVDEAACASALPPCLGPHVVAEGSTSVYIENSNAARTGDRGACAFAIGPGSADVIIGGRARDLGVRQAPPRAPQVTVLAAGLLGPGVYVRALSMGSAAVVGALGAALLGAAPPGAPPAAWLPRRSLWSTLPALSASLLGVLAGSRIGVGITRVSYPPPSARSELLAREVLEALGALRAPGQGAVGVLVHQDGSVTLALGARGPSLSEASPAVASELSSAAARLAAKGARVHAAPELPPDIVAAKLDGHRCPEAALFAADSPSRPVAMSVKSRDPHEQNSERGFPGDLVPCPACARNVAGLLGPHMLAAQEPCLAVPAEPGAKALRNNDSAGG